MNGIAALELATYHALQIAVLAGIVYGLTRCWAKNRPHLAHALWALVLLKCLTPPVISSPISPFSWVANFSWTSVVGDSPSLIHEAVVENSAPVVAQSRLTPEVPHIDKERRFVTESDTGVVAVLRWLVIAWSASSMLLLVYFAMRFIHFTAQVRATSLEVSSAIVDEVNRLRRQLGIRRPVQVRVLSAPIGPAVMGIWRPVLLLPQAVVEAARPAHLRLLLAHELIHIRRGDLIWSALQVIASSLWWFHPAVRLTNRMLTRESERSCDEETITSLACQPATYARSLLAVLEVRQQLCAAPIVPGLRPVDITSQRMERIMQIGHGSRAHTPGWVVATLIAGAVILLPGAAWLQAKEKPDERAAAVQDPAPAVSATLAALEPEGVVLKARMVVLEVPADRVKEIRPVIVQRPGVNDAATANDAATVLPVQSDQGSKGAALPVDSATPTTTPWIMDDVSLARVEEWLQGSSDDKVKILCRPQLAMLNGSSASLTIGVERPFVVAVNAESGQPTVDIKHLGLTCKITATLPDVEPNATAVRRYRWVGVQCELTHTDMMKVEESAFIMNVPLGVTIATTAGTKDQDDGQRTTVWLITVDTLPDPTSDSEAQPVDAPDETDAKSEE